MSVSSPAGGRQPLLPEVLARSFNDLAIRVVGSAFVAFAAIAWLALISWQLADPRLGQTAGKATRNLLGPFGAGLSDLLVQTLGIAAVFALICPMVWGLEMLAAVRWIPRMRIRLAAYFAALLTLAALASGLPAIPGWPLPGGSGGMLGDIAYNIAAASLPGLGTGMDTAFVLIGLSACGLTCLLKALGLGLTGLVRRAMQRPASASPAPAAQTASATFSGAHEANHEPAAASRQPAPVPSEPAAAADSAEDADDLDAETTAKARFFAARFAPAVATGEVPPPRLLARATGKLEARRRGTWRRPALGLLRASSADQAPGVDVTAGARALHEALAAFGVKGEINEARPGPVVTRYELEAMRGTKLSRVIGLADDFARELGASAVRVSVTPGRSTIGIEVPNELRELVMLRDVIESEPFAQPQMRLPLALGKGISGEPIVIDLARMPHLLVAGTTGSGKSVGLHAMVMSLVYRHAPADLRLMLIDPKMLELAPWDGIPHLLNPVITDPQEAIQALDWAVGEMEQRYQRMARHGVRSIDAYNDKVRAAAAAGVPISRIVQTGYDEATGQPIHERQTLDAQPMPYIVIVVDELADLMVTARQRIETSVQRLAQKARAAGIHLVLATQRPSVDVVTGTIKANLPVRLSYRVASKIDSRTIIGEAGAEQLLGNGDMLLSSGSGQLLRVHGAYVSDAEIGFVSEALRSQGAPEYVEIGAAQSELPAKAPRVADIAVARAAAGDTREEDLYAAAIAVVAADRKVSPGHLHRRMGIAQDLAARLIARMEAEGLVGSANLLGRRPIHMSAQPAQKAVARVA